MDVGVICKEAFLCRMEEVCAVVDACLFARRATKNLGFPGIEMAVEVNDANGTICTEFMN